MRILAFFLAALLCSVVATAVPDSAVMGPYKVSFDLGLPKDAYSISITEPKEKESLGGDITTEYKAKIQNNTGMTRFAYIYLYLNDKKQPIPTPEELAAAFRYGVSQDYRDSNIDSAARTIDGLPGMAGSYDYTTSGVTIKVFMAEYYTKIDEGRLYCIISSTYPWDEGTLQLLKTIHVEKANATA